VIDFRYHLVSLVAVFLALALGVLLGTTQLSGAIGDDLKGQVAALTTDKRDLQADVRQVQGQVKTDDAVTASLSPRLVNGVLRGTDVVLVATPQANDGTTDAMQKMLEQAGAKVTGRVQLTEDYSNPQRAADLKSFVTASQPSGFQLPESDDAGVLAGALLSYALVGDKDKEPEAATTNEVLSGFTTQQMLRVDSPQVTAGDLAVLVTSGAVRGDDAAGRVKVLTDLASALDRAGRGVVVAGTAATARAGDGLVFAVRSDRGLAGALSTVDDADRPVGQVAAVFALAQESAGRSGQYGTASGADAPFPPLSSS
jgi:Copper transport outer membrane protein, MctB